MLRDRRPGGSDNAVSPADLHERGHGTLEMRRLVGGADLRTSASVELSGA
jgi:hypothetical protein